MTNTSQNLREAEVEYWEEFRVPEPRELKDVAARQKMRLAGTSRGATTVLGLRSGVGRRPQLPGVDVAIQGNTQ